MKKGYLKTKCDEFWETEGMCCFTCEREDCTYETTKDPVRFKALGKETTEPKDYRRWDEEIAW